MGKPHFEVKRAVATGCRTKIEMSVLRQVREGVLAAAAGAARFGVTERHFRRLRRRFEAEGRRGRHARPAGPAVEPVAAGRDAGAGAGHGQRPDYADFGPTLLAEQVERDLDLRVSAETVRAWLTGAGLWTRKRKRAKHRSRRPRRAARGELLQWDSSVHAWLEDRGPPDLVLIALHDDATSGPLFAETSLRTVAHDFTVRFGNRFWQVTARDAEAAGIAPGSWIVVERRISGELRFRHGDRYLTPEALGATRPTVLTRGASTSAPAWHWPWPGGNAAPPAPTGPIPTSPAPHPDGNGSSQSRPAGVGRDRRVGIRAPEACRFCAGRSAHPGRPCWQAQCELRAIRVAAHGPLPGWPPPGQSLATETDSAGPAATGLKAPGAECSAPSSPGLFGPHARRPTAGPPPREEPTCPHHQSGHFGQPPDISSLA